MNLLETAWIPVRRASGQQDWVAPWQIAEPDIVALDSVRADFNGALVQFLIGLIQTTTPMDSHAQWQQWRSEEHTSELQSRENLVCRLLLEKKKKQLKAYSTSCQS